MRLSPRLAEAEARRDLLRPLALIAERLEGLVLIGWVNRSFYQRIAATMCDENSVRAQLIGNLHDERRDPFRRSCNRDCAVPVIPSTASVSGEIRAASEGIERLTLTDPAVDLDRAAVLLGHDVVADREAEAGALAGRLGGKERLEQPVLDLGRNADAIVPRANLDDIAEVSRHHL